MRKLITYACSEQLPILETVRPHYQAYADAHGYQFVACSDQCQLDGRSQHWAKVKLLQQHLPDSELCLWIDCDFVLRAHEDVADYLQEDDIQGMVMEQTPHHGVGPNTGLWLLKNCNESIQFLEQVWTTGPLDDAKLNDQATVAKLLGFSYLPDYTRPLHNSEWLQSVSWLPLQWNMLEIFHPEAYLVANAIHFGGMPNNQRLQLIERQLIRDNLPGAKARAG